MSPSAAIPLSARQPPTAEHLPGAAPVPADAPGAMVIHPEDPVTASMFYYPKVVTKQKFLDQAEAGLPDEAMIEVPRTHPLVVEFLGLPAREIAARYAARHEGVCPEELRRRVLAYLPRHFCWAGSDLFCVEHALEETSTTTVTTTVVAPVDATDAVPEHLPAADDGGATTQTEASTETTNDPAGGMVTSSTTVRTTSIASGQVSDLTGDEVAAVALASVEGAVSSSASAPVPAPAPAPSAGSCAGCGGAACDGAGEGPVSHALASKSAMPLMATTRTVTECSTTVELRRGRQMIIIETNSCPSGVKSMPWAVHAGLAAAGPDPATNAATRAAEPADAAPPATGPDAMLGGYMRIARDTFMPLIKRHTRRHPELASGRLAVLYDKNPMEARAYAHALARASGEPVLWAEWTQHDVPAEGPVDFARSPLVRRDAQGVIWVREGPTTWHPLRAAFRYVTQRPWNRLPATPVAGGTLVLNPVLACLAGGRNKAIAAYAYGAFNANDQHRRSGLQIRAPATWPSITLDEVEMRVRNLQGHAVVKVPYANAGQGIYTITNDADLQAFLAEERAKASAAGGPGGSYDRYVVQRLIGHRDWSGALSLPPAPAASVVPPLATLSTAGGPAPGADETTASASGSSSSGGGLGVVAGAAPHATAPGAVLSPTGAAAAAAAAGSAAFGDLLPGQTTSLLPGAPAIVYPGNVELAADSQQSAAMAAAMAAVSAIPTTTKTSHSTTVTQQMERVYHQNRRCLGDNADGDPSSDEPFYVADLRMMVAADLRPRGGPDADPDDPFTLLEDEAATAANPNRMIFRPMAIYARRAAAPLEANLDKASATSWDMLGTNLSEKRPDGTWTTATHRLITADEEHFPTLGLDLDDLIDAFVQTCMSVVAIDQMADDLLVRPAADQPPPPPSPAQQHPSGQADLCGGGPASPRPVGRPADAGLVQTAFDREKFSELVKNDEAFMSEVARGDFVRPPQ
ncbi:hypothetical protein H696_05657 [Fonticula alba]|uniref:Uncharacterized protein n=1 Tax=Fonticula alba TaxID=691883 RepID=A0A058Z1D0_FONAL|nr:hypothetical protein H696_05657 [Fonticula alba]KCV67931.1 hypothetical protein H696_05657 [Fonticula alba]|eukprot:XP_009497751.1 hypothetical protein H696_05657 [Fonticula alba]